MKITDKHLFRPLIAVTVILWGLGNVVQAEDTSNYLAAAAEKGATRWPDSRMPIRVFIQDGTGVEGYRRSYKADLEAALKQWATATGDRIRFETVTADKALMNISWTANSKEMMSTSEGGHTEVVPDTSGITQVTMKLLTKQLNGGPMSDAYAIHIMLHEIGHALGVLGHSPNASDIMYYMINEGDTRVKLSDADVNTVQALYSSAGDKFVNKPIDVDQMLHAGESTSPVMQSIRLNDEAAKLLQSSQYAPAMHKLEQAHILAPDNALITQNLGSIYANVANIACMMGKLPDADRYFQKAIPLLQQSQNKDPLKVVLKNYATILRANGRLDQAVKMELKLKSLK